MKEPLSAPHFYIFMSKKKKRTKKKCKMVDRKSERAVYTKGVPNEGKHEKI